MTGNFYKSKAWTEFMQLLRLERVNGNGEIICEHCGKPITRKYDCIGHHKIELTEENFQNTNISLNPENVMLVHHKCHNKIHDKLGLMYAKQVYLVYGSPFAGKHDYVLENMNRGDLIIDIDDIWQCLSGQERYIKPNRLRQNVFSIRDELLSMVRIRQGNWLNAYVVGGYPLISEREHLCKTLGAREIFIDTSKEECLERALRQISCDYNESKSYIEKWWELYSPH